MRAGRLDRLITIQVRSVEETPSGGTTETWMTLANRRPASVSEVRGDERFSAPQIGATEQKEFRIRYSANVANINPRDYRIVYPALSDDSPEDEAMANRVYDILATPEIGRNEGIKIIAQRRPDVTP